MKYNLISNTFTLFVLTINLKSSNLNNINSIMKYIKSILYTKINYNNLKLL